MAFSITAPASTYGVGNYQNKNRSPQSITFDSIVFERFTTLNLAASQSGGTIQDAIVIPQKARLVRVGVTAQIVSGHPTIQVCPSGGVTNAAAVGLLGPGNGNGYVTLTCNGYTGQTIAALNQNLDLASGTVLALHAVTTGADTATGMRLVAEFTTRDEHPTQPINHALKPTDY